MTSHVTDSQALTATDDEIVMLPSPRDGGNWNDLGFAAMLQPFTTITGPTLDVTATMSYAADTIVGVSAITFDTVANSNATFSAAQFGGGAIASDATITGDGHTDTMGVRVGAGKTFDGSQLQFSDWTASDKFEITAAGDGVTITGTSADDVIDMGAFYDTTDVINGGSGSGTLELDGNYTSYVNISAAMFQNIDTIELAAGHDYSLDMLSGAVAAGETITINASKLLAGDRAFLDTYSETAGSYVFDLGAGNNTVDVNSDHVDTVHCTGGENYIDIYGVMPSADKIYAAGTTDVSLYGDYSAGYTFGAHQFTGNVNLYFEAGNSYDLTLNNAMVSVGGEMVVNGNDIGSSYSFILNGSHVTNGDLDIFAGAGVNDLTGGAGNDEFLFYDGNMLTAADHINGGGGTDNTLVLDEDYSAGLKFDNGTIRNIQYIDLDSGYSYNLTLAGGNVLAGQTLDVEGEQLTSSNSLVFNGSKAAGNLDLFGGAGSNTLIGGSGTNTFNGGAGDMLTGGSGVNNFDYSNVSQSTSTTYDTITGFNAVTDTIGLFYGGPTPNAIDAAVTTGTLSSATFDANLAAAIGANQLHAGDAVLFTPNAGTLKGDTFLIVDSNGTAGYQAGADLVIELTHATNLSQFGTSDFT